MESIGQRLGTTQTQDYVLLAALAVAGYVVYQTIKGVSLVGGGVIAGAKAISPAIASALANIWVNLSPSMLSSMSVAGNVLWPDGTTTALSQLTVKEDNLGNVYVSDGKGLLFQLQPSNAQGNWPAVQITDPSQIGQSPTDVNFGVTAGGW